MAERPRYEESTISRRGALIGALVLLAILGVSAAASILLDRLWWPSSGAEPATVRSFADSRLDPALAQSRLRREAEWAARARSYGWVDREAGVAHVPVERAVELILAAADEEARR